MMPADVPGAEPTESSPDPRAAPNPDLPHPELPPEEFRRAATLVAEWVADYRERVAGLPVRARVEPGEVAAKLPASAPEAAESIDAILRDLDDVILPGITHWGHPGFFAYFPSSPSGPGTLAEFAIAGLGVNAMVWRTSPAATELEERVVSWMREAVGLPDEFRGVILDTASTSSFTALLAARERAGVDARRLGLTGRTDLPLLTVYVSEQAHSSLEKAAIAAGLGQQSVRRIATDDRYRMDPAVLSARIAADRAEGCLPTMIGATIGTTSSASVDPVDRIAEVAAAEGVWLHIDAAYAGPAALLPECRPRFTGWEHADSIVLNPHKWMGTPMDCSVLLFRDSDVFRASLALTPAYLSTGVEGVTDLMDFGLPLGRRFRALKLWFVFRSFGTEGLRAMLRWHIQLAEGFASWIDGDPRFQLACEPSFGTVCFRALAVKGSDADALNREVMERVNRAGRVFLSHTELDGKVVLRLSVGGVATRAADVEAAFEALGSAYDEVTKGSG